MNFGDLLFALNCDPLKNEIRKIEKINKRIVQTKNGINFNKIYIHIYFVRCLCSLGSRVCNTTVIHGCRICYMYGHMYTNSQCM